MRLLVISHTPHYRRGHECLGWGATVRELDHLASLFEELVHIAPVHSVAPPRSAQVYRAPNIRLVSVRSSGGSSVRDKLGILGEYPGYAETIHRHLSDADVVHIRCPCNLGALALVLLALRKTPEKRWIKYAGNWGGYPNEPRSYIAQRWWLRAGLSGGVVTVNGKWGKQPPHVVSFLNPCLTTNELASARLLSRRKSLEYPLRIVFVGKLVESKGPHRTVRVLRKLHDAGIEASLSIVGGGPERSVLEDCARNFDLEKYIEIAGWRSRDDLTAYYRVAHFILHPSRSEGWPKVISEAMAYGAIPIAGRVGSIGQLLDHFRVGRALNFDDVDAFANAIIQYAEDADLWKRESRRAAQVAEEFTYSRYLERVRSLRDLPLKEDPTATTMERSGVLSAGRRPRD